MMYLGVKILTAKKPARSQAAEAATRQFFLVNSFLRSALRGRITSGWVYLFFTAKVL
jgi:hypothetical protein